ncbi:hypothetical protein AURDEDRAFT_173846 [Auricularia subglabra TFB-10046 SS5]|uniref:F-box domain-containing protein n=1 Tax=Auricularia subglabra (strain TFB-10046 / SS5) TaxID=717982 RepID=J0DAC1_AURST|nr:hypothetical protein AURDEDRAFT_173846 [Auricularia subglabra TFB-10046 SS5]
MAEHLPIELVLEILRLAAEARILVDRPWVLQLALVSPFAYDLISPVLFRTLVIGRSNIDRVLDLAGSERGQRLLHLVRRVSMCPVPDISLIRTPRAGKLVALFGLLGNITELATTSSILQLLTNLVPLAPHTLTIYRHSDSAIIPTLRALTGAFCASLTHLTVPYWDIVIPPRRAVHPEMRLPGSLDAVPRLTHLALWVQAREPRTRAKGRILMARMTAVLECERLEYIALHVASCSTEEQLELESRAAELADPRLHLWCDHRANEGSMGYVLEAAASADFAACRNAWTQARRPRPAA